MFLFRIERFVLLTTDARTLHKFDRIQCLHNLGTITLTSKDKNYTYYCIWLDAMKTYANYCIIPYLTAFVDGVLINLIEIKSNYSHKLCIFLCFSFDNKTNIFRLIASKFNRIERKHLNSCLVFDIFWWVDKNELVLNCKCSCLTMCINTFNIRAYIVTYTHICNLCIMNISTRHQSHWNWKLSFNLIFWWPGENPVQNVA